MSNSITLPPIVVTPNPPTPLPPIPLPPVINPGYIAKPLPWNGITSDFSNIDQLMKRVNFAHPESTMTQVVLAATTQKQIADAYAAHLPAVAAELDAEIATAMGSEALSPLDQLKKEKALVDGLLASNQQALGKSTATANAFFGRNPLGKDMKANAVDFSNTYYKRRPLDFKKAYQDFVTSYGAAYESNLLSEKIRRLTEKSTALAASVAAAQAQEDKRLEQLRLAAEALRQAQERAARKEVPVIPAGVSLDGNLEASKAQKDYFSKGGDGFLFSWFYKQVRNKGPWDYKQQGAQFQEFGNFNYGAVGAAAGISEQVLLRAAGAAQSLAGTSKEEFQKFWTEAPYGDDPVDQVWVKAGIDYAKSKGY